MFKRIGMLAAFAVFIFTASAVGADKRVYRVRMFFGLALPHGGSVSLEQWREFELREIAKVFKGFNVVDSTGYYKGKPERSKIVTVIVTEEGVRKAEKLAKVYAGRFRQESVMMVKIPVEEWRFIGNGN